MQKMSKYNWAVKTESTGIIESISVDFVKTRKDAREMKKSHKGIWKKCKDIKVTIHKAMVGRVTGTTMIGKKEYY